MNEIIEKQLKAVERADLTKFDAETNTYFIPKRQDIKLEEDHCYLINLKDSFFKNETVKVNWNNNSIPAYNCLKVDIAKIMVNMIKVVGVAFDQDTNQDISYFWSGWVNLEDMNVLKKLY